MGVSQLQIDGQTWEIMGNITSDFLPYTNTVEASRSGKLFTTSEAKAKTVTVENIMLDPNEFSVIKAYFSQCGSKRFNVTVSKDQDCGTGSVQHNYINCVLSGEPKYSLFENKMSDFEFAYETHIERIIG
jgi:hypothetical protein